MGLFGNVLGLVGGNKASKRERKSAKEALAEQRRQFDLQRADYAPYRESGSAAITEMGRQLGLAPEPQVAQTYTGYAGGAIQTPWGAINLPQFQPAPQPQAPQGEEDRYGAFRETPGYRFQVDETMKAVDRMGRARGRRYSGGTIREAQRYSAGLADQEYGDYFNRLASVASGGQQSVNSSTQAGQQYADNAGSLALYQGASRASAIRDSYGAAGGVLDSALGAFQQNRRMKSAGSDVDELFKRGDIF